jgi:hypothetical protein
MKLYEIIGDWLNELPIVEQARRRGEVESKITNTADMIIVHLIKLLRWKDPYNYAKHLSDIDGWLKPIFRIKMKQGFPKQADYYRWMFTDIISNPDEIRQWVSTLTSYAELPQIRNDDEVYNIIKNIMYNISVDFSKREFNEISFYLSNTPE